VEKQWLSRAIKCELFLSERKAEKNNYGLLTHFQTDTPVLGSNTIYP